MHGFMFFLAVIWVAVLFGVTVFFMLRASTILARVLAFDTLTLILIAFLILGVHTNRAVYYLDAVLILALLSFIGTLAAAWYYGKRSLIEG